MADVERTAYMLKHPITLGSERIEQFNFRRPVAGDFRRLQMTPESRMADQLDLASILSGQTSVVVDKLDLEDMLGVLEIVGRFFPDGLATGRTT